MKQNKNELKNLKKCLKSYIENIYDSNIKNTLNLEINKLQKSISNSIKNSLNNLNSLNNFKDSIEHNLKDFMIESYEILGEYGWCFYYIEEINDTNYIKDMNMINYLKKLIKNPSIKNIEIDKIIAKNISKKKLLLIIKKSKSWLDEEDITKLKKALKYYKKKQYYDSATILLELIDAQNIKQELFDLKQGKYKEEFKTMQNNKENIDQGWNAFSIVFRNNFSMYFNNELLFGRKNKTKSKKILLDEFVKKTKYSMDIDVGYEVLSIAYPLFTFFDDISWKNYPNKPNTINRNWLMHGMYSYNDITKYDCIKLFLILYQLSHLFYKLKKDLF